MVELEKTYERVADVCLECGAHDVLIAHTLERQEALWENRGAFLEALKGMGDLDEVDVVVPPSKISDFITFTESLGRKHAVPILSFGHAGDGNLHIYILRGDRARDEWLAIAHDLMNMIYAEAKRLNGQVSGEHGIGFAKRPFLEESLGSTAIELMRGIKAVFDPKQLLNPGKVI